MTTTVNQLGDHMPQGILWEAKTVSGSNTQGVMYGVSKPINTIQQLMETLATELNINATEALVDVWEASTGLPDTCTGLLTDLTQRRNAIIERIRKVPIVTLPEMQTYIDSIFPDKGVVLSTGVEALAPDFTDNSRRFIIVVDVPPQEPTFELEFEYDFISGVDEVEIRCVLERVIPANVVLLFRELL
jgi:hypothetical protein